MDSPNIDIADTDAGLVTDTPPKSAVTWLDSRVIEPGLAPAGTSASIVNVHCQILLHQCCLHCLVNLLVGVLTDCSSTIIIDKLIEYALLVCIAVNQSAHCVDLHDGEAI